jgi:glycosyltransferase involved in cell wall biosynthesis
MLIVHLTASTFYGGPERQMLGLAHALPEEDHSVFLSFAEGGRCRQFLAAARQQGFEAVGLTNDSPRFGAAVTEIGGHLERLQPDALFCHGYKADLLGRKAARRLGVPCIAVSRGWTGESFWVRLYEGVDRFFLRWMDRVVCVSSAQAERVKRCGVRPQKIQVVYNAIDPDRFADPDPRYEAKLRRFFRQPKSRIIGAAGRLSPEKGFNVLVAAAEQALRSDPDVGFILFGEGPCREHLIRQINSAGLAGSFVLTGFRADFDRFLPYLDVLTLPSFTEGLPNVVLEAAAAGVPIVATAVGGTPEVVEDGVGGFLVPPGDPDALAEKILHVIESEEQLRDMGLSARQRVLEHFTFAAQARLYRELVNGLKPPTPAPAPPTEAVPFETEDDEEPCWAAIVDPHSVEEALKRERGIDVLNTESAAAGGPWPS